jgi:hypothetical protein
MAGLEDQLTITISFGSPKEGNGPGDDLGPFFVPGEDLMTKAEADYTTGDGKQTCGSCLHYGAGSCNLVAGGISPEMVCDYWESELEADVVEIQQGQSGRHRVKK